MKELLQRWLEMENCEKEFASLEDLVLREQFYNACDRNLSILSF